jgi:UPF0755 protein
MKKSVKLIFVAIGLVATFVSLFIYHVLFSNNLVDVQNDITISCREPKSIEEFIELNQLPIRSSFEFKVACTIKRFSKIKPGNYRFTSGMSNTQIIHHLRSGGIPVVNVRLDSATDIYGVAGVLGASMRFDSMEFITRFLDPFILDSLQTDSFNLSGLILPNTYEFYWNMSPKAFLERMMKEQASFWTTERKLRAQALRLSEKEVVILASIVKAETASLEESNMIAGLYLNRLSIGMPLQSDPTAIFGTRKNAQRVYLSDIQSDNPYNTYKFRGLPPGPINLPEAAYIDAVLEASTHRYIYMCAQPGGTGRHNFAVSLSEHENNRRAYIRWLNSRSIE